MKVKTYGMSRSEIRKLTKKVREVFNIDEAAICPVVSLLESLLDAIGYSFDILEDKEMKTEYAVTIPSEKLLRIRESVYNGACEGNVRDRFTIAHEIAHLLLHDETRVVFARSDEKIPSYLDPEWQANTFAGELLVPVNGIKGLTCEDICKRYNVSKKVAQIQSQYSI